MIRASGHQTADTVLLVEDDEPIRLMLTDLLCSAGFDVRVADDGRAAIAALRECRPPVTGLCLVIIDMMLPEVNGLEVLHELAVLGNYVPSLVMSADRHQLSLARMAGAEATIPKPFEMARLLDLVERTCGRR